MAQVILLRGVSGAGKSTVSKFYEAQGFYVASADKFFEDPRGEYNFNRNELGKAHQYCFDMYRAELCMGHDVVVDNTNTSEKEIAKYVEFALERGHELVSLVVENRHGNDSVHNVPQDVRKAQAERIKQSLKLI